MQGRLVGRSHPNDKVAFMIRTDAAQISALADEIAQWLREQLDASGAERFVLAISGGVDSALVAALCTKAAGSQRVLGAILPSHSNPADAVDGRLVAETFGIPVVEIDLTMATETFLAAMPATIQLPNANPTDPDAGERQKLAVANVRPRLRMTTLYYLATVSHGIVAGTGNKSEASIGYYTKYGDGGVDLLPIVDLYKHEVRAMAAQLGVPQRIIDKAPSAGLWTGQTDEGEIGMTYDQLDAILIGLDRGDLSGLDPAQVREVQARAQASEHKRRPIPAFRRNQPAAVVTGS